MGTQLKHCLLVATHFQLWLRVQPVFVFPVSRSAIMALMPYRVAGAALAAGAGYQGYLQALPVLEFVVDPREMRSFARRQIRRLATMAVDLASESESGAAGDPPLASDRTAPVPAGTGTTSEWTRGAWQLVQQNTWLFAFPCLAVLWVCSQAMQVLAGIYWAVCAATRLFWQTGSLACRMARWPARLPQLAPTASWPMPGRFCCICGKFARLPFPTCDYCWDTPSYHHGRCCPWKPAEGREGVTTGQSPSDSCRLECTKVCRAA